VTEKIPRLGVPYRYSSELLKRAIRTGNAWPDLAARKAARPTSTPDPQRRARRAATAKRPRSEGEGRPADHPSDALITLVARTLDDFTALPSGEVIASTRDVMEATRLSILPVRGALSVLLAAELLERVGSKTSTRYRWNLHRLEELAAGAVLSNSQLAQNESCASAGTRAPDVVAAPRRAPSATIHLDVAAAQGICRALGFDGIQTRDKWLTVSGVGAWKKDRPASWAETCERIEACASAANVQDEQFARELLFNFCTKDPRVVAEGGAPLMLLNKSPAWVMTSQQFGSRKRVRAELERPTSTPPDVVGFAGAADVLDELEALAGRAAGGAR